MRVGVFHDSHVRTGVGLPGVCDTPVGVPGHSRPLGLAGRLGAALPSCLNALKHCPC